MGKLLIFVLGLASLIAITGCGGRNYQGDQRFPLEGMASFDGEPIDLGSISLIPTGGGEQNSGRATGGTISEGKYAVAEDSGPTAGTYRVEIRWLKKTGKQLKDPESGEMYDQRLEVLPKKFNESSELTVEIPAPDNKHDFALKSS